MGSRNHNVNALQVQSTNDSSIISKCSMAKKNYVKDDFLSEFVEKNKSRTSLINLGYCTRAVIFSEIVIKFIQFLHLQKVFKFQIISCGSGFDTSYWRLTDNGLLNESSIFVEIDFPNVVKRKISLIKKSEKLKSFLNVTETGDKSIYKLNHNFYLLSCDLSDVKKLEDRFRKIKIDFNTPTLFLSECVITYMKVEDSNRLVQWIAQTFQNSSFVNYEQIHPEDGFGNVMLKHFDNRQSTLHSVVHYPNVQSHEERFKLLGFDRSVALSEWHCFLLFTTNEERERILTLEQFDEFEEFHLKCSHYVVAVASKNILSPWSNFMFESQDQFPMLNENIRNCFDLEKGEEDLELFGHASCSVGTDTVLIFGGFGPKGRSNSVYKFTRGNLCEIEVSANEFHKLDMIHGSTISFDVNGRTYIGLYGGRTSPNNVVNSGDFLIMEYNENNLTLKKSFKCDILPRYRHSITCHSYLSGVSIWIFGGRTADLKRSLPELSQCIIYPDGSESFSVKWTNKTQKSLVPCPRMSHSASINATNDALYISCGLDAQNFSVLNDLWKWSIDGEYWERIQVKCGSLIPRYGHTSHIKDNILYLLGGVNTTSGCQPGLALLNLDTFHLVELTLQPFRVDPVLLFNHTSAFMDDNDGGKIIVFGGGGNCFSFGTFFNKTTYAISLKQFRS